MDKNGPDFSLLQEIVLRGKAGGQIKVEIKEKNIVNLNLRKSLWKTVR